MVVSIRALNRQDIDEISRWFESDSTFPGDFSPFAWKISKGSFISKMRDTITDWNSSLKFYIAQNDSTPLGLLLSIKPENFDFFEIGYYVRPEERGKGYGSDSVRQFTDFLFKNNHRVFRIEAGTSSLNLPSQRLLEKAGFVREGVRRKTLFRNGEWEDSYLYALIRD